jgi:hypothetical protein
MPGDEASALHIRLSSDNEEKIRELALQYPNQVTPIRARRLEGSDLAIEVIAILSPALMPIIYKVIVEALRARQHVELRINGIKVRGVSEATLLKIMEKLTPSANRAPQDAKSKKPTRKVRSDPDGGSKK